MSNVLQAMMGAAGGGESLAPTFVMVGMASSPYLIAYPFDKSTGFGTAISGPATLPIAEVNTIAKLDDSIFVFQRTGSGTGILAYPFTVDTGWGTQVVSSAGDKGFWGGGISDNYAIGAQNDFDFAVWPITSTPSFGTRGTDIASADDAFCVAFNSDKTYVALGQQSTPFITVHPWDDSTGTAGTAVTAMASPPTSGVLSIAWAPDDSYIFFGTVTTPFIGAVEWTGSGFGARASDPATLPSGDGNGIAVSPSGDYVAVAHDGSPGVTAYPWTGSAFGAKLSNPSPLPSQSGNDVAFSRDGAVIIVAHSNSPYVSAYTWSGAFGAKYSDPATLPTSGLSVFIY
jgi:hypothetical protein